MEKMKRLMKQPWKNSSVAVEKVDSIELCLLNHLIQEFADLVRGRALAVRSYFASVS